MKRQLIAVMLATSGLLGLALTAFGDDVNTEVCRAVMAMGVNPFNPRDTYAADMLQRYPDMTYNQAKGLVDRAFRSVQYHENPMCDGIKIPADY